MALITIIFPPATDPRSPHLAPAALAAATRAAGIPTETLDLDVEGLHALVRRDTLDQAGRRFRATVSKNAWTQDPELFRLARVSEGLAQAAPEALFSLRDARAFYDPHTHRQARQTLYDAAAVLSSAAGHGIRYGINPAGYTVDGFDADRVNDLLAVTGDDHFNLFAEYWHECVYRRLDASEPDLIGVSILNRQQMIPGLALARELRRRGHFVVIGGTVLSKFRDQLARSPVFFEQFADAVVLYEGETALVELALARASGKPLAKVPNLMFLDAAGVQLTATHVEDVERLPTPDFSGLPLHLYLAPEPVLPLLMGKGCYHNRCRFCEIPYINSASGAPYRRRSTQRVARDILELNRTTGCRHFEFTDESLAPTALEELGVELASHSDNAGFCFVGYARLDSAFTAERCRKLARMGLKKLFFGLESGHQATLDHMQKGIVLKNVRPILQNCTEAGIKFHLFSIIGFPEESEPSARQTLEFFQATADLIDRPGNSFDIHAFGLELRSAYAVGGEQFGVVISPDLREREFAVGAGNHWINARGMSHAKVQDLLHEFESGLAGVYQYAGDLEFPWPAFEEYSVLYSDHFGRSDGAERVIRPRCIDATPAGRDLHRRY